jgi:pilus assembly protein Flp/PilA
VPWSSTAPAFVFHHEVKAMKLPELPEREERGATAVEYGLMVAMIAIVIVGAVMIFGQGVVALFSIPAGIFSP